ncbi:MAG: DNA-3-methyladenine glycosylase I [Bdellovibrionaceae bacterium]|nr:DNA-3-methyladenine glycosylase I [Pseudobdellovibrionaceae bacterium]
MKIKKSNDYCRCGWCLSEPIYIKYHDEEWGVPIEDDRELFEFLILEGAQAGLSWLTILKRRNGYKKAFANFNPKKVARFSDKDVIELLKNENIIRNRLKIESTITNAKAFLKIQEEFGSFYHYSLRFIDGKPIINNRRYLKEIPPTTKESDAFSKDLKQRGFKFVGSRIIYAHMQAVGMVNDHLISCFRYRELT